MSRYFFHVHGVRGSRDEVGEDLPSDEAAWEEATIISGELFRDIDGKFRPGQEWTLEVQDHQRNPIYVINISAKRLK